MAKYSGSTVWLEKSPAHPMGKPRLRFFELTATATEAELAYYSSDARTERKGSIDLRTATSITRIVCVLQILTPGRKWGGRPLRRAAPRRRLTRQRSARGR